MKKAMAKGKKKYVPTAAEIDSVLLRMLDRWHNGLCLRSELSPDGERVFWIEQAEK
jgi:hypothetical protein